MKTGSNDSPPPTVQGRPFRPQPPTPGWTRFQSLLIDYTARRLSHNNDIFNACTGLYHHVYGPSRRGNRLIFGLPEGDFHAALRWKSDSYTARAPESAVTVIPSWSWAAVNDMISWMELGHVWEKLIYDASRSGEDLFSKNGAGGGFWNPPLIAMVRFEVCLDSTNGWTAVEPWYGEEQEEGRSMTEAAFEHPYPVSHHTLTPGRLRFRTQSALFELHGKIGYSHVEPPGRKMTLDVRRRDCYTKVCQIDVSLDWAVRQARPDSESKCYQGHDALAAPPSTASALSAEMYVCGSSECSYVVKDRMFKFVLVSAVNVPPHSSVSALAAYIEGGDRGVKEEVDSFLGIIPQAVDSGGMCMDLQVMLVDESEGRGAARRIGIAAMRLRDWLANTPVMEDIVLE